MKPLTQAKMRKEIEKLLDDAEYVDYGWDGEEEEYSFDAMDKTKATDELVQLFNSQLEAQLQEKYRSGYEQGRADVELEQLNDSQLQERKIELISETKLPLPLPPPPPAVEFKDTWIGRRDRNKFENKHGLQKKVEK